MAAVDTSGLGLPATMERLLEFNALTCRGAHGISPREIDFVFKQD